MNGFKRALTKVFGENLEELHLRLSVIQQIGWIVGISIWIPGLLIWVNWLLQQ